MVFAWLRRAEAWRAHEDVLRKAIGLASSRLTSITLAAWVECVLKGREVRLRADRILLRIMGRLQAVVFFGWVAYLGAKRHRAVKEVRSDRA